MVSWAHTSLPPNRLTIGSAVFAQLTHVSNTQTTDTHPHADRAQTYVHVAIGCIYAQCTGDTPHNTDNG